MGFGPKPPVIQKLHAMRVNAAILGVPIPIVFGQNRLSAKLIWYGDFTASKAKQQGGKGLSKGGINYVYSASVMAALCHGPVSYLLSVWDSNGRYVVESASESYTVGSPYTYTPTNAGAYANDQGPTMATAYSYGVNDYGSSGPTTLSGTTQAPMSAVASGTASDGFNYSGGLSASWTVLQNTFAVANGVAYVASVGASNYSVAYWNGLTFSATQSATVVLAAVPNGEYAIGPAVRIQSASTFYAFYVTATRWILFASNSGTIVPILIGPYQPNIGDAITLSVSGSTLTAAINDVAVASQTNTLISSAGHAGVVAYMAYPQSPSIDSWSCTGGTAASLSTGQYSVNPQTGVYTFSPSDNGKAVQINYAFYRYRLIVEELDIVPFSSPYHVTVDNSATFKNDYGVKYYPGGTSFSTPSTGAAGTYSQSGGTYTFNAADAGQPVVISYEYQDQNTDNNAPNQINLTLINGAKGQPPWAYLTTAHPSQALGYTQLAAIASSKLYLGYSTSLPNYNYEIAASLQVGGGIPDANPADCINALLTDAGFGIGFPAANLGSLTAARTCWTANQFFISPVLENQRTASSVLAEWLAAGMCAGFWSEGLLKFVPYCDTSAVYLNTLWQPSTTPVASFTDDDFLLDADPETGAPTDPVKVSRTDWFDAYNRVQVVYSARVNDYNPEVVYEQDDAAIARAGGMLRLEDPVSYEFITALASAQYAASMRLQRLVYVRNTYEFRVKSRCAWVEPMDVVTVTDSVLGLSNTPVRVQKVEDDPEKGVLLTCEDFIYGAAAPAYNPKSLNTPSVAEAATEDPGDTTAVLIETPNRTALQKGNLIYGFFNGANANWGGCHVWLSFDGVSYTLEDTVYGPSRVGKLTADLAASSAEPDNANTLAVQLINGGQLVSVDPTSASQNNTLSVVMDATAQRAITPNGNFEQSNVLPPPFWTPGSGVTLAYDTTTQFEGSRSLRATYTAQYQSVNAQLYPANPGETYYVSAAMKNVTGAAGCAIQITAIAPDGSSFVTWSNTNTTSTSWVQVATSLLVPSGAAYIQVMFVGDQTGGGSFEFDAVTAFRVDPNNPTTPFANLELLSYTNVALQPGNIYDLTALYRAQDGTAGALHKAGSLFAPLADAGFEYQYDPSYYGKTVYFKLTSFNLLGMNEQALSDVEAYAVVLAGSGKGAIELDTGNLLTQAPGYTAYHPLSNPLRGHDAGGTATIYIDDFYMRIAGQAEDVFFYGGTVTGLQYATTYYVFFDDPPPYGGAVTYQVATTNPADTANYNPSARQDVFNGTTRFFVGSIITPASGAGDTIGNDDGGHGQFGRTMRNMPTQYTAVGWTNPLNAIDNNTSSFAEGAASSASLVYLAFGFASFANWFTENDLHVVTQVISVSGGAVLVEYSVDNGNNWSILRSATAADAQPVDSAISLPLTVPTQNVQVRVTTPGGSSTYYDPGLYCGHGVDGGASNPAGSTIAWSNPANVQGNTSSYASASLTYGGGGGGNEVRRPATFVTPSLSTGSDAPFYPAGLPTIDGVTDGGGSTTTSSIDMYGFPSASGSYTALTLTIVSSSNLQAQINALGVSPVATASAHAYLQYSLNGGSTWTTLRTGVATRTSVAGTTSGGWSQATDVVTLSPGQSLSQIRVRCYAVVTGTETLTPPQHAADGYGTSNTEVYDAYTTGTLSGGGGGSPTGSTHYVVATQFGFSLPSNATVDGIQISINKGSTFFDDGAGNYARASDNSVVILKAGSPVASKSISGYWPSALTPTGYGGSTDSWGVSWSYSDINNSGFGVAVSAALAVGGTESTVAAYVGSIEITVFYHTPGGASSDTKIFDIYQAVDV